MKHSTAPLLLGFLLIAGCGKSVPATFQVTGMVTYQGKPLPLGSVMFVPEAKTAQAKTSAIDASGHYRLDAAPGRYLVQVQMAARLRGQPAPGGEGPGVNVPEVDWLIPEEYSHFQTSGIEVVVEPGKANQINLSLPPDGRK
jgi:hypothetical protein